MEALHLDQSEENVNVWKVRSRNYAPRFTPAHRRGFFNFREGALPFVQAVPSTFRAAKPACKKDDKAYQKQQANPAAADDGTTKVESAAAEQKKENHDD
jgi:hypothetical protein